MNIFVGNLSPRTTDDELREIFERFGTVLQVRVVKDRHTGRSRRCGFVVMSCEHDANEAVRGLFGYSLNGQSLALNLCLEAPQPQRDASSPVTT